MRPLILLPLLLLFFNLLQADASDFRTFTDAQGRKMKAKLTTVSGKDVYIERDDGYATKVDISIFGEKDQAYIRKWARIKTFRDESVHVRFRSDKEDRSGWEKDGNGIMRKTWRESYEIILSNNSRLELNNIRIEYLIFKFEDAIAAQKRREGEVRRLLDETESFSLKAGEKTPITTKKFPMLETKLEPGYVWEGGGKKTSKDVMEGIWIKIYVDDVLAIEVSKPENLIRKEEWPTSSAF